MELDTTRLLALVVANFVLLGPDVWKSLGRRGVKTSPFPAVRVANFLFKHTTSYEENLQKFEM